ncbi:NifU family protein [Streptomyces sp. HUAS TT20]|uniref:NifU family protein n=1 Tax=Streptomyces sp. HUAS TT20 TaxID=3447509 RepID=UPI0021DAEC13|nr:NifU family protein [Streptomyces sp. HUAS 15-9]UXY25552.1 NifU family protein [Streptomyces sp. HUAS 15-9]
MIPLHPQQVPGRPDQLRWIMPAGTLPCTGPLTATPAPLAALVEDGTLASVTAEPAALVTALGPGRSWSREGARVRTAIHSALDDCAGWSAADTGEASADDALLDRAAHDLLGGAVGQFARSHGGAIELVGVQDGVVTVRLAGACHGCPASWITLHHRLEQQLRNRCPSLVAVRNASSSKSVAGLTKRLPGVRRAG